MKTIVFIKKAKIFQDLKKIDFYPVLETYMNFPDLAKFFFKLDNICMKHAIGERRGNWIEYHHSDFFKADNQVGQPPKRKNSKFFKICQTLKTDYRVRKFPMDAYNDRKKVSEKMKFFIS